jgi:hypothetical protein
MPDWKKLLADQQRRKHSKDPNRQWSTYSRQGWEKAERIAEELDCNPSQVGVLLKDSIQAKRIEREEFMIWSREADRLEKVVAFRKVRPGQAPAKKGKSAPAPVVKPAAGMTVRSRRGGRGKIRSILRGRCEVEWESGTVTQPSLKAFKKRDIFLEA